MNARADIETSPKNIYNVYIQQGHNMNTRTKEKLLLGFRLKNTSAGVTRATVQARSTALDIPETGVIHLALAKLARDTLPAYEPDDGPLTAAQLKAIQADADAHMPKGPVRQHKALFS